MTEKIDFKGHTEPTEFTRKANQAVRDSLPLDDPQDFEDARRGLIVSEPNLIVTRPQGRPAWDMTAYDFVQGEAPDTVNPSLWRQAKLNNIHGLFEVTKGVYQVRAYDLSNLSIIEGKTGWIVVDPMTTMETTAAAFELAKKHLDPKPVVAIIHTHSHIGHYGGILSIVSPEDVTSGKVRIIAPGGIWKRPFPKTLLLAERCYVEPSICMGTG